MSNRKNLPLSALRAFESVATHLHMGKAGEDLGVTQGAISHQIRSLEERLEVQLFSRAHNKLTLTPAGNRLYSSVKTGFDVLLDGTRNLQPNDLEGPLVIACTHTIATNWAAKNICEFFQHYPTIDITIREIKPRQKTIPRDIDVAICYGEPDKDDRQIIKLSHPPLYPVCHPSLLRNRKPTQNPIDITNFTLIHDHQVSWNRWLREYGVSPEVTQSSIRFPNTSQALTAAKLGFGVALGNSLETQELIREGQLMRLLNKPIAEEKCYYLLTQNNQNKMLKAQIFEEWIIQACEQA